MSFFSDFAESVGSFLDATTDLIWSGDSTIYHTEDTSGDDTIFFPVGDNYSDR